MFKNPHEHTIIGIVKTHFQEDGIGDQDDILALASGEMESNEDQVLRSFKPWVKPFANKDRTHLMVVE